MALNQQVFRIRTDATAAQGGAPVWAEAQNANPVLGNTATFRIRSCTTAAPASQIYNLFVSKNAGAYAQVPNTSSGNPVYSADATAGASADNSALTTSLLTGATGTFSNVGEYDLDGSTAALAIPLSGYVELEYALKFNSAAIATGDTYAFRVYGAGVALTTYTVTPTLQVWSSEAFTKLNAHAVMWSGGPQVSKMNAHAVLFPNSAIWVSKVNAHAVLFPNSAIWVSKVNAHAVLWPGTPPPPPQLRAMIIA